MKKKIIIIMLLFFFWTEKVLAYPCDNDEICEWPETCNTCDDCHSCDIDSYTGRRAKYIDQNCLYNGNGLANSCAEANGQPGRFNELQLAINSLSAGDTLYIYPGDYYRAKQQYEYGNYNIYLQNSGTAENPVIITAYNQNDPPVLYSLNPQGGSAISYPALNTHWDDAVRNIIIDGIKIDGLLKITGNNNIIQNLDCTFGGGSCDGNWSCLRIEWCTDCLAHHNFVHDVDDAGFCPEGTSRPAGLKEFSSTRAIWEYNTVRNALQWGYDLHRSSIDTTVRYNRLENSGWALGIKMGRSGDNYVYGNTVVGGQGSNCIKGVELNEEVIGPHNDLFDHNTCVFSGLGITTDSLHPTTVTNNVISNAWSGRVEQGNINIQGSNNTLNYNAYDSNGYYHDGLYEGRDYDSLAVWMSITSQEINSHEATGGYCQFVDPPSSATDFTYDLRVIGACLTGSNNGGQIGAYGITDCVGHACSENDQIPLSAPAGLAVN